MDVEFTIRYDRMKFKHITACRPCEGMGARPGKNVDDDFTRCRDCLGTGKTNWAVALIRIPEQIRKNWRFFRENVFRFEIKPPHQTKLDHILLVIKIALRSW